MKKSSGFTLIEIMITVLIIGILLAIAMPSFSRARARSRYTSCIANLRQIQGAKEHWAMENRQPDSAIPTGNDLYGSGKYLNTTPVCAANGTYTIGNIATAPSCTVGGMWPHRIE